MVKRPRERILCFNKFFETNFLELRKIDFEAMHCFEIQLPVNLLQTTLVVHVSKKAEWCLL